MLGLARGRILVSAICWLTTQMMISGPILFAAEVPATIVGAADRDITPELGMEQPGGYGKAFHRSLHDPCKVHAVVFSDGKNRVALVSVDALFVRRELVLAARKRIHNACGIPEIGRAHV